MALNLSFSPVAGTARYENAVIHGRALAIGRFAWVLVVLAAGLLLPVGCGGGFSCPFASNDITWESFGRFKIGNAGPDETARQCVSACGWHVFQGNDGGIGNTLQVASPDEDVVFVWAYSSFAGFRLKSGWTGETERGIRLGDSLAAFEKAYPDFSVVSKTHLVGNPNGVRVDAYFDTSGVLSELLVGGYISV